MQSTLFNLKAVHPSWQECIQKGLTILNLDYLRDLSKATWLPGPDKIFNAFSLPLDKVNYVLFGESPYPRPASANGYAFWDAAVCNLWAENGLSKSVNRATSLRNLIKMLLVAEGLLDPQATTQANIAKLDKSAFVQTNEQLFQNFLTHGFLLLNATPVLQLSSPHKDARAWIPFISQIMDCLYQNKPDVAFLLFGNIASNLEKHLPASQHKLYAEHPYNLSFILNEKILNFFRPLHLLRPQIEQITRN